MKKIFFISMLMAVATSAFSQQAPRVLTDYLQKAKNQKTVAWILLGGGSVLYTTGLFTEMGKSGQSYEKFRSGKFLTEVGGLLVACSIPLFIIAARNKRKAMASSAFFKMETIPVIEHTSFVSRSYPALSVKVFL